MRDGALHVPGSHIAGLDPVDPVEGSIRADWRFEGTLGLVSWGRWWSGHRHKPRNKGIIRGLISAPRNGTHALERGRAGPSRDCTRRPAACHRRVRVHACARVCLGICQRRGRKWFILVSRWCVRARGLGRTAQHRGQLRREQSPPARERLTLTPLDETRKIFTF